MRETAEKAPIPEHHEVQRPSSLVHAEFGALTHPGNVRENNEDHYLILKLGRDHEVLFTNVAEGNLPLRFKEWGYVMLVADGLGGEAKGELAKSEPNSTKLRSLLSTTATAIQTVASMKPAYELLKVGLTYLGITLP